MAKTSRLLWNNETLGASVVVSSSTEATGYQDDYVKNRARWKKWRSATSTADQWVKFNLGSAKSLAAIFAVNYKVQTGGTIYVQANSTDSWTSPAVNEALSLPSVNLTRVAGAFFGATSRQWVRVFFDNVASANDYAELGLCFAGSYIEPTRAIQRAFLVSRHDPSLVIQGEDGQEEVQTRSKYHAVTGEFRYSAESEKDNFTAAFDTVGAGLPFIFAVDTTDPHLQFYGRFAEALNTDHNTMGAGEVWTIPFTFMESR